MVSSPESESEAASVADHLLLQDLNELQVKESNAGPPMTNHNEKSPEAFET